MSKKPIGFKKRLRSWLHTHRPNETMHRWLGRFAKHLTDPKLWHFNRRTVAKGVGIGLFVAFIPVPLQIVFASIFAIMWGANLPVSIALTWITNPFTFIPILYATYRIGNLFLHMPSSFHFPARSDYLSYSDWFIQSWHWLLTLGKPLLIGIPITAVGAGLLGYAMTLGIWNSVLHLHIRRRKRERHHRHKH